MRVAERQQGACGGNGRLFGIGGMVLGLIGGSLKRKVGSISSPLWGTLRLQYTVRRIIATPLSLSYPKVL